MINARRRPVRVSDILIVVAASAVGLGVFNVVLKSVLGGRFAVEGLVAAPARGWTTGRILVRGVDWIALALPFAASWTFLVPILRLRSPRPRRPMAQAGPVACVGAIVGLAWASVALGITLALDRAASNTLASTPERWLYHFVVEEVFADVGLAVASAWVGLALSGRWRRSSDWVDGFGRILGGFWIVTSLVWACRRYLAILDW